MTSPYDDEEEEEPGFFKKYRILIGVGVVVVGLGAYAATKLGGGHDSGPSRKNDIVMIKLPPLPPPPPPPPPPKEKPVEEPKVDQKMEVQEHVDKAESKPQEKHDDSPKMGTNNKGSGPPDGFGLGDSGNGRGIGGSGGSGGGSRFGWYAAAVQAKIADALRSNPRTRNANIRIVVRIWPDLTGRITRVQLTQATGDSSVDDALKNEVLNGLQLQEPPPSDMPVADRSTANGATPQLASSDRKKLPICPYEHRLCIPAWRSC